MYTVLHPADPTVELAHTTRWVVNSEIVRKYVHATTEVLSQHGVTTEVTAYTVCPSLDPPPPFHSRFRLLGKVAFRISSSSPAAVVESSTIGTPASEALYVLFSKWSANDVVALLCTDPECLLLASLSFDGVKRTRAENNKGRLDTAARAQRLPDPMDSSPHPSPAELPPAKQQRRPDAAAAALVAAQRRSPSPPAAAAAGAGARRQQQQRFEVMAPSAATLLEDHALLRGWSVQQAARVVLSAAHVPRRDQDFVKDAVVMEARACIELLEAREPQGTGRRFEEVQRMIGTYAVLLKLYVSESDFEPDNLRAARRVRRFVEKLQARDAEQEGFERMRMWARLLIVATCEAKKLDRDTWDCDAVLSAVATYLCVCAPGKSAPMAVANVSAAMHRDGFEPFVADVLERACSAATAKNQDCQDRMQVTLRGDDDDGPDAAFERFFFAAAEAFLCRSPSDGHKRAVMIEALRICSSAADSEPEDQYQAWCARLVDLWTKAQDQQGVGARVGALRGVLEVLGEAAPPTAAAQEPALAAGGGEVTPM